jgi:hypothetical protein
VTTAADGDGVTAGDGVTVQGKNGVRGEIQPPLGDKYNYGDAVGFGPQLGKYCRYVVRFGLS